MLRTKLMTLATAGLSTMLSISCASESGARNDPAVKNAMAKPDPTGRANPQMLEVLQELAALNPKPIEKLSPTEARQQPTPTDAVMQLMKKKGMDTTPMSVGNVENRSIPADGRQIPVRVYTPKGDGPFPVTVYIHGGGWVIATLDTYDASCRVLTNMSNCVVVSVDYRQAPEHKFPAAHEDCYGVLQWVMNNAKEVNGDPARVAIAGESAGGNMAAAACLMAKDRNGKMPVHQLLIYPVSNYAFDTPSYRLNANAKPLNKAMMGWFFDKYVSKPQDGQNKYLSITRADNLKGLSPATVITAEIDPLMSEGKTFSQKLQAEGVPVKYKNFNGVTHEFFGMGTVVDEAKAAEEFAADSLKTAFGK